MKNLFSPKVVLILALLAVFVPVTLIEYYVIRHTNGTFMYPLDDTFIHMALAKNLAFYGNWGMNRYAFASASSSPSSVGLRPMIGVPRSIVRA